MRLIYLTHQLDKHLLDLFATAQSLNLLPIMLRFILSKVVHTNHGAPAAFLTHHQNHPFL